MDKNWPNNFHLKNVHRYVCVHVWMCTLKYLTYADFFGVLGVFRTSSFLT